MDTFEKSKGSSVSDHDVSAVEVDKFIPERPRVIDDGLGPKWKIWRRRRYMVVILAFLGQVTREVLRINLSVAVLPMTENRSTTDENGTTLYVQEFEWNMKDRGFLLSVFFYGLFATTMLGGLLAVKYGGSKLYSLGMLLTATTTLLTPAVAHFHFYVLIALRIFEGMCEGLLSPSLELVYAAWVPLQERNSLVCFVGTGFSWGAFLGMAVSSAVAQHLGWQAVFFVTGAAGLVWYLFWLYIVKETPGIDKRVSSTELRYIENSLGNRKKFNRRMGSVPYAKIFTSLPLWSLIIAGVPLYSMYSIFTTMLPAYMKDVLKHNTQNSGILTSLPFAVNLVTVYCFSPAADYVINRNVLTTTAVRKIYICGCLVTIALFSFVFQQVSSTSAVLSCFIIMQICFGIAFSQVPVNILELAPSYSSVMGGLVVSFACVCSMVSPTVAGHLTQSKTAEEWHVVFSILTGMCLLAAAIYGVFGSGRLQTWATKNDETDPKNRDFEN